MQLPHQISHFSRPNLYFTLYTKGGLGTLPDVGAAGECHGDVVSSFHRDVVWVWQVYPIMAWDWRGERVDSDKCEVAISRLWS